VKRPRETGLGGDDGILELEEVEDVQVVYEEAAAGRVAKFRVSRFFLICIRLLLKQMTDNRR
jgi:hypothetical protein